jgi:hypothetical protein
MNNLRDGAIIGSLIDELNRRRSFCGETHVQKGAYFLKELTGVAIDSAFSLYLYGPYSFDVHTLLNQLRAEDVLKMEPQEMGATWKPGERFALLARQYPKTIEAYRRHVAFVADRIASLRVVDLERFATALLVVREASARSSGERVQRLLELKPHIAASDARSAFATISDWLSEAAALQ